MTLGELASYTEQQLDWANGSSMDPKEAKKLWTVVQFARSTEAILAACSDMGVADLATALTDKKQTAALKAYANALKQTKPTVELEQTTALVSEGVTWGSYLTELEKKPGGAVVKKVIPNQQFLDLINTPADGTAFLDYVKVCDPLLHAEEGMEITSFQAMQAEGAPYKTYNSKLKDVRNFHRFEKNGLDQLVTNLGDTSKKKPLTLVLHTALDHNGAFHRDPKLTDVLTNSQNLTLMIEGAETLGQAQSRLKPIAKKYGQKGKIDQAILAGHGNVNVIEMAGRTKVEGGELQVEEQPLISGEKKSDEFFTELMANMDPSSPNHRVVLNACLTNSNEVDPSAITATAAPDAQKQVAEYIKAHPSLATYLNDKYKGIDFKGANASIGVVDLIDPTSGKLDLYTSADPKVTAPKLEYVEQGKEPLGAMRALAECWGKDNAKCQNAVTARIAKPLGKSWAETIIQVLYKLTLNQHWTDFPAIAGLVGAASGLAEFNAKDKCRVDVPMYEVPANHWIDIFPELLKVSVAHYVHLVIHEAWMTADAAKQVDFLEKLGDTKLNCQTAKDFVDLSHVDGLVGYGTLLGTKTSASGERGKNLLALLCLVDGGNDGACISHLAAQAKANGNKLPVAVKDLLKGAASEDEILVQIGLKAPPVDASGTSASSSAPAAPNNLDTDGDGVNDTYAQPMGGSGKLQVSIAKVRSKPEKGSPYLGKLTLGQTVQLAGKLTDWYAIRYGSKCGFLLHDQVKV